MNDEQNTHPATDYIPGPETGGPGVYGNADYILDACRRNAAIIAADQREQTLRITYAGAHDSNVPFLLARLDGVRAQLAAAHARCSDLRAQLAEARR